MTNEELRAKLPSRFASYPLFNCAGVNDDAVVLIAYQYCVIQENTELLAKMIQQPPALRVAQDVIELDDFKVLERILKGPGMGKAEEAWFRIKYAIGHGDKYS